MPERIHIELITKVQRLIPEGARVVVLGDGEFDGVDLQALVKGSGWEYVLRTSKTMTLTWEGEEFRFDDVTDHVAPEKSTMFLASCSHSENTGPFSALLGGERTARNRSISSPT